MKKNFKFYAIAWTVLLGLFNLLAFILPAWPNLEKYTASFWIGWSVTIAAFFGQLICSWVAFKDTSAKKTFYNISLYTISYTGLIGMFVVSMICIIATPMPYWIAAIACAVVLAANILAVLKATVAIDLVTRVDEKVEQATAFIYEMRVESESLFARANTDNLKAICKKVCDAFKYSDPMSNAALAPIESQIKVKFASLFDAVVKGDDVTELANEVCILVDDRNRKCKLLK